jgi:urocanate hydratase
MDKRVFSLDDLEYPPDPIFKEGIRRAPSRGFDLSKKDTILALKNALRYVPIGFHERIAPASHTSRLYVG